MLGVLVLVAEFLFLPLIAALTVLCELIVALGATLLQVALGRGHGRRETGNLGRLALSPRATKWILWSSGSVLGATAVALLLANFVFLGGIVRWTADRVETKTGIAIRYESIQGNLFSGAFSFGDVSIVQDNPTRARLAIEARAVEANLSMIDLLFGRRAIDSAAVSGATVRFETLAGDATGETNQKLNKGGTLHVPKFEIRRLDLQDIAISVVDQTRADPVTYQVEIERFESQPLRSRYLWFDILFRSNLEARLNGSLLRVENSEADGRHATRWSAGEIDAPALASLVGGPFSLFESGKVSVEVSDEWEIEQRDEIQMDWNLRVSDARARLPEGTPPLLQPFAQIVVNNINANERDWDFGFHLTLSEAQFEGAASLDALQIWQDALPVMLKQIAELAGVAPDVIKENTQKAFDRFKSYLQKRKEEKE